MMLEVGELRVTNSLQYLDALKKEIADMLGEGDAGRGSMTIWCLRWR